MSTPSEKIKKLNDSIYLTEAEREQMDGVITNFMDIHPLENPNMIKSEKQSTYFSFYAIWGRKLAFAVITLIVIFGASGGVVFASNDALPGDLLYPVKINVAEEIKSAMIFSTKEKANWEAERLQLRLKEMQQVVARTGSLSSELVKDTEARVLFHTGKVSEAAKDLEKMGDTKSIYEILDRIQTSLDEYNGLLQELMEKNLPANEADIQNVITQIASTEQNVRLAQQQNIDQINEVVTRSYPVPSYEEPKLEKIFFASISKNTHIQIGSKFNIVWYSYNIPSNTPGYISLWSPSGIKATNLFASPDIAFEPNQITWNVTDVKPGTWRLRMDLNKDGSGPYWLSDVFVIENNNITTEDTPNQPNEYGCNPSMICDAGQVCRNGMCVENSDAPDEYGCHPSMKCDAGQMCRQGMCVNRTDLPTYNNDKYGYKVSYPTDWHTKEIASKYLAQSNGFNPPEISGEDYKVIVGVLDVDKQKYLDYIATNSNLKLEREFSNSNVNGLPATQFAYNNLSTLEQYILFTIETNNKTYIIWTDKASANVFINSFNVYDQKPTEQNTENYVGYGYIKKYDEDELAGGFSYYVESEYTPKISIGNCDKRYSYLDEFIVAAAKSQIMTRVYGTKSVGQVCINKIAVVPDLGTTPDKYTGIVKEFADGGYGSYSYYVETADGSKIGITTCDKRALGVENLVAVAIKTGVQVDIIGYKINTTDKDICLQGLMTK